MQIHKSQGQSVIEYILVFVVAIIVVFIAVGPNGFFVTKVENVLDVSVETFEHIANSVDF